MMHNQENYVARLFGTGTIATIINSIFLYIEKILYEKNIFELEFLYCLYIFTISFICILSFIFCIVNYEKILNSVVISSTDYWPYRMILIFVIGIVLDFFFYSYIFNELYAYFSNYILDARGAYVGSKSLSIHNSSVMLIVHLCLMLVQIWFAISVFVIIGFVHKRFPEFRI